MAVKKQSMTYEDIQRIWDAVSSGTYDWSRLDQLTEDAVRRVRETCAGKKVAYGWSGGKDALALEWVMRAAGIEHCVMVRCDLEFPAFVAWAERHRPENCEVVNTGWDLNWLARNPGELFPQTSAGIAKWSARNQGRGQAIFVNRYNIDMLLVGRRRQDGNIIAPGNVTTNAAGVTKFSPIFEWQLEDVFAAIVRLGKGLPPFYTWPRGWKRGSGPWAERRRFDSGSEYENLMLTWNEIHTIDPEVVRRAAAFLPSGREFLQRWLPAQQV